MWVRARTTLGDPENPVQVGFLDGRRIYEGDVFEVKDEPYPVIDPKTGKPRRKKDKYGKDTEEVIMITEFSETWMEPLTPEEVAQVEGNRKAMPEPVIRKRSPKVKNIDQSVI